MIAGRALDGNRRRKFHIGFGLIDRERQLAAESAGNCKGQLAPGNITAQLDQQLQLHRGFTASRQPHGDSIPFAHQLGIGWFGSEFLDHHIIAKQAKHLIRLCRGNSERRVELSHKFVDPSRVSRRKDRDRRSSRLERFADRFQRQSLARCPVWRYGLRDGGARQFASKAGHASD